MAENVGLVAKLQVGDFVDVRDTLDVWRVGFVISATGTYVGIKYMGWSDLFIQGIARTSHRLAEVRLLRGGNMGCACCLPDSLCLSCPPSCSSASSPSTNMDRTGCCIASRAASRSSDQATASSGTEQSTARVPRRCSRLHALHQCLQTVGFEVGLHGCQVRAVVRKTPCASFAYDADPPPPPLLSPPSRRLCLARSGEANAADAPANALLCSPPRCTAVIHALRKTDMVMGSVCRNRGGIYASCGCCFNKAITPGNWS